MAIIALLAVAGFSQLDTGPAELVVAHQEISGSLDQAFVLARARGTNVKVAVGKASGAGEHLRVQLSPGVKWGKPTQVPLPPGMDEPAVATRTGEAHTIITVTPRHTALACAWFLHAGNETLCMRLSGQGRLKVLRWHEDQKRWARA
jgi:hypothetical protein